ncbi:hypothetical protein [Microvirga sp. VF16]|uniref:hypothetical protein n=1 Tax=Microvirga sp. VF16 TaxID=2807101 RepID=UPI001FEE4EE2|nr:hypothetical protein [Microvirga sp. VF16]
MALDKKRHAVAERLARETRIGWVTLAVTAFLIIFGTVIVAYLCLNAGIIL